MGNKKRKREPLLPIDETCRTITVESRQEGQQMVQYMKLVETEPTKEIRKYKRRKRSCSRRKVSKPKPSPDPVAEPNEPSAEPIIKSVEFVKVMNLDMVPPSPGDLRIQNQLNELLVENGVQFGAEDGEHMVTVRTVHTEYMVRKPLEGLDRFFESGVAPELKFTWKVIFAAQRKAGGIDAFFFSLHVEEYGEDAGEVLAGRTSLSYVDSVKESFFADTPQIRGADESRAKAKVSKFRSTVLQTILNGYLDNARHEFHTAHLTVIPLKNGPSGYGFYLRHPGRQPMPDPDRLKDWYVICFDLGKAEGIVDRTETELAWIEARNIRSLDGLPLFYNDAISDYILAHHSSFKTPSALWKKVLMLLKNCTATVVHLKPASQSKCTEEKPVNESPVPLNSRFVGERETFFVWKSLCKRPFLNLGEAQFTTMCVINKLLRIPTPASCANAGCGTLFQGSDYFICNVCELAACRTCHDAKVLKNCMGSFEPHRFSEVQGQAYHGGGDREEVSGFVDVELGNSSSDSAINEEREETPSAIGGEQEETPGAIGEEHGNTVMELYTPLHPSFSPDSGNGESEETPVGVDPSHPLSSPDSGTDEIEESPMAGDPFLPSFSPDNSAEEIQETHVGSDPLSFFDGGAEEIDEIPMGGDPSSFLDSGNKEIEEILIGGDPFLPSVSPDNGAEEIQEIHVGGDPSSFFDRVAEEIEEIPVGEDPSSFLDSGHDEFEQILAGGDPFLPSFSLDNGAEETRQIHMGGDPLLPSFSPYNGAEEIQEIHVGGDPLSLPDRGTEKIEEIPVGGDPSSSPDGSDEEIEEIVVEVDPSHLLFSSDSSAEDIEQIPVERDPSEASPSTDSEGDNPAGGTQIEPWMNEIPTLGGSPSVILDHKRKLFELEEIQQRYVLATFLPCGLPNPLMAEQNTFGCLCKCWERKQFPAGKLPVDLEAANCVSCGHPVFQNFRKLASLPEQAMKQLLRLVVDIGSIRAASQEEKHCQVKQVLDYAWNMLHMHMLAHRWKRTIPPFNLPRAIPNDTPNLDELVKAFTDGKKGQMPDSEHQALLDAARACLHDLNAWLLKPPTVIPLVDEHDLANWILVTYLPTYCDTFPARRNLSKAFGRNFFTGILPLYKKKLVRLQGSQPVKSRRLAFLEKLMDHLRIRG